MAFESVQNYYEKLVFDEIDQQLVATQGVTEPGTLEDIACMALNKLPARYFRHNVDMAFFLTSTERNEMAEATRNAVAESARYLLDKQQTETGDESR